MPNRATPPRTLIVVILRAVANSNLLSERELQAAAYEPGISEVSSGEGIAPVEDEGAVGQILHVNLKAGDKMLLAYQVHST